MEEQEIQDMQEDRESEEMLPPTLFETAVELIIRLFILMGTTVLISVIYKLIIETNVFGLISNQFLCRMVFCGTELILLLLYWHFIFIFSKISRHRTYSLKAYYLESGIVFSTFSFLYLLAYVTLSRESFLWIFRITVNLIGLRFLTYAPESLKYYMLAFLAITALVMALEPWIAKGRFEKWEKDMDNAIQNPGEKITLPAIWQSVCEIIFRLSVMLGGTALLSAVCQYVLLNGRFEAVIQNETVWRISFCIAELLLLAGYFSLCYRFSILSRFRSASVKSYYIETTAVFAVFSMIYLLSYLELPREIFLWLFRITINLIGIRFVIDVPASLKVYMLAFLGVLFLILYLEPLIAWILYKREKNRMKEEQEDE